MAFDFIEKMLRAFPEIAMRSGCLQLLPFFFFFFFLADQLFILFADLVLEIWPIIRTGSCQARVFVSLAQLFCLF